MIPYEIESTKTSKKFLCCKEQESNFKLSEKIEEDGMINLYDVIKETKSGNLKIKICRWCKKEILRVSEISKEDLS